MRVVSLVVEGLERARDAGFLEWVFAQDADIICLQDTRCSEYSLSDDAFFPSSYNAYFWDNIDDHRQNGVAIYCRDLPKAMITGMGFVNFDTQGLYIQADYEHVSVGSILVPSGVSGETALARKGEFLDQLAAHLEKVRHKRREFILCGGWELVQLPIDAEEAGNRADIPGYSPDERGWLAALYQRGYRDAFRAYNTDADEFSWWPEGDEAGGVRTDTHIVSESLAGRVDYAAIFTAAAFSAHAPVIVDYDIVL